MFKVCSTNIMNIDRFALPLSTSYQNFVPCLMMLSLFLKSKTCVLKMYLVPQCRVFNGASCLHTLFVLNERERELVRFVRRLVCMNYLLRHTLTVNQFLFVCKKISREISLLLLFLPSTNLSSDVSPSCFFSLKTPRK